MDQAALDFTEPPEEPPPAKYLIGVDESGYGSWVGAFMVSAVAVEVETFNAWASSLDPEDPRGKRPMLRDSKKMPDARRRRRVQEILDRAITTHTVTVPLWRIAEDYGRAWRWGILAAIQRVEKILQLKGYAYREFPIVIDGSENKRVRGRLKGRGSMTTFESGADDIYPAVMAASILAKTAKNDEMLLLDQKYPEFLWAKNAGYGTAEHWEACQKYGVTSQHRPIPKLMMLPGYEKPKDWYEGGRDG